MSVCLVDADERRFVKYPGSDVYPALQLIAASAVLADTVAGPLESYVRNPKPSKHEVSLRQGPSTQGHLSDLKLSPEEAVIELSTQGQNILCVVDGELLYEARVLSSHLEVVYLSDALRRPASSFRLPFDELPSGDPLPPKTSEVLDRVLAGNGASGRREVTAGVELGGRVRWQRRGEAEYGVSPFVECTLGEPGRLFGRNDSRRLLSAFRKRTWAAVFGRDTQRVWEEHCPVAISLVLSGLLSHAAYRVEVGRPDLPLITRSDGRPWFSSAGGADEYSEDDQFSESVLLGDLATLILLLNEV